MSDDTNPVLSGAVANPAAFRPVVIAPTYNHARFLSGILDRIAALHVPFAVVDDGSTDGTAAVIARWAAANPEAPITVLSHAANRGKAGALRTGFTWAAREGFSHACTIDTDGQLDPEQIPDLLDVARTDPCALILGRRREDAPEIPRVNLIGWYMSALGLRLETQWTLHDSQCGLRVYPLSLTQGVRVRARRFGYEAEIIARAAWAGFRLYEVPVSCHYRPAHRRDSHFRPWTDGCKGFFMHARLTMRRLNPWPMRRIATTEKASPTERAVHRARLRDQFSVRHFFRRLTASRLDQLFLAAACGIGTFMAALPLGGWQIGAAVYSGARLRVHFLPLLLGTALAYLPSGRFLESSGEWIGHKILHGWSFQSPNLPWPAETSTRWAQFAESVLGGVIVGFFANWITIGILVIMLRLVPVRRPDTAGRV